MRQAFSGSFSLGVATLCVAMLGLGGCAASTDGVAIGTPTAAVEGLVLAPAPTHPVATSALTVPITPSSVGTRLAAYVPPPAVAARPVSPAAMDREAARLKAAMAAAVPADTQLSSARQMALTALAQQMAAADHLFIRQPQLVLIVDRSPRAQLLAMTLAEPDGNWDVLGTTHVSTGKPGRLQHFKTPVGVLLNDGSEIGYRAQGTFNQNHIRGLGVKGMRVWDFGWQTTDDWRTPGGTMAVRVEMHATDPSVLEERIGRADSEGCIRLPDALNRFLDRHGIIDAAIERLGETDGGYRALLSPYLDPTPLAGDAVIVVDSSEPWAKPYPPETTVALSD